MNKVINSKAYKLLLMRVRGWGSIMSLSSVLSEGCAHGGGGGDKGGRELLQCSNDFELPSTLRQQQNHHGDVDALGPN